METIGCYDCSGIVSMRAFACPHCGSREPLGPYAHNQRELRSHRIEYRNDRLLGGLTFLTGSAGFLFGAVEGSNWIFHTLLIIVCCMIGLLVAAAIIFFSTIARTFRNLFF